MSLQLMDTKEIQKASFEVLCEISRICEEQGIKWFLTYGTLIGAIRNKGIIPWDDDIDIMMPRPDYERFVKYFSANEGLLQPYKMFDKTLVSRYPHLISRVSDQRFHLVFDNEIDYGIGVFVDIYPLDGVGNNYKEAVALTRKTKRLASLCFLTSRKRFGKDNTESMLKQVIKFPIYLWAKIWGNQYYINKLNKLASTFSYSTSKYVACAAWPVGKKYGRERDVFEKSLFELTTTEFEGKMFPIPKGYDLFLQRTYGDYMTPPPKKGRKTHHTYSAYRYVNE